jgi:ABC-type transporter MlaC component
LWQIGAYLILDFPKEKLMKVLIGVIVMVSLYAFPANADCDPAEKSRCTIPGGKGGPMVKIRIFQKLVKSTVRKNMSLKLKKQFQVKLDDYFDFSLMAKAALHKEWSKRTPQEQALFSDLFAKMLKNSYLKKLVKHKKYAMKMRSQKIKGKKARVKAVLMKTGGKIEDSIDLLYKMRLVGTKWKIYDVITDEVSLVRNYRSTYLSMIRKKGFNSVIVHLKKVTK